MPTYLEKALNILIVDDDEVDRMALERALNKTEFRISIVETADAEAALKAVEHREYDCIFLDYNLPGKNGLELTQQIRHQGIRVPLIVLTGQGDEQTAVELMKAGASDYLPKHKLSSRAIARLIHSALRVFQAEMSAEEANKNLIEKNVLLERTNQELERQRRYIHRQNLELQEVSRLKSEFLATMSHELRTPLNAIIGFSQILLSKAKGPLSEKQEDMLSRVLANGRNLLELINDILAFSKIEAGRLALAPAAVNLEDLVKKTLAELKSLATQKSLQLEVDIDLDNPTIVNDEVRVRQVLVNLLSNAIKFTETGSVRVRVRDQPEQAGKNNEIMLSVTDTGCGMDEADQAKIFSPFHQVDQKVTRRHDGTGLGLTITYSLVKLMNGDINLVSKLQEGTAFTVTLPRKVVPDQESPSIGELSGVASLNGKAQKQ